VKGFRLNSITKKYRGRQVLSKISCSIAAGTRWGILGPSGSGKSTLLRIISGLEAPDAGEIYLDGNIISRPGSLVVPAAMRGISMVFQDLALWPNLTALENVVIGMEKNPSSIEQAKKSLEMCGIMEQAHSYPAELSGGEQQRLALARAMARKPRYLFLDEPFSGLDIGIKANIIKRIKALPDTHSITTVLVTHDPFEAVTLCEKVICLDHGEISDSGNLKQLLEGSKAPIMKAFREFLDICSEGTASAALPAT